MFKVCYIIPIFPPQSGGCAIYFSEVIDNLPRNVIPYIITSKIGHIEIKRYRNGFLFRLLLLYHLNNDYLKKIVSVMTSIYNFFIIIYIVKKYNISIIHYHTSRVYVSVKLLQYFLPNLFFISDLRDQMSNILSFKNADLIIANSKNAYDYAKVNITPNSKIKLIYKYFIPKYNFEINREELNNLFNISSNTYILYIGEVSIKKGVPTLLDAFNKLSLSSPDIDLLIIGPKIDAIRSNNRKVNFLGPVENKYIPIFLKYAEIFVLPSTTEGLSIACLEAFAYAKKYLVPFSIPEFQYLDDHCLLRQISSEEVYNKLSLLLKTDIEKKYNFERHKYSNTLNKLYNIYYNVYLKYF